MKLSINLNGIDRASYENALSTFIKNYGPWSVMYVRIPKADRSSINQFMTITPSDVVGIIKEIYDDHIDLDIQHNDYFRFLKNCEYYVRPAGLYDNNRVTEGNVYLSYIFCFEVYLK